MRHHILIPLFLILTIITPGRASEIVSDQVVRIAESDTLDTDLIAASQTVEVLGRIEGDVFAAGQFLTIEGSIADNLTAGFQSVKIHGDVGGMVVAAAQTIVVDAEIGDDLYAFGSEVRITENGVVRGNVIVGCGFFRLEGGRVEGWVEGGSGTAFLNGTVKDSVILETGSVDFGKNFQAKGTRLTTSQAFDAEEMQHIPENLKIVLDPGEPFFRSIFFYASFLSAFVIGALLAWLFPTFTYNLLTFAGNDLLRTSGIGFLALLGIPVGIIILGIMIVTIPLTLIALALYLILLYVSSIISGFVIGHYVLRRAEQPVTTGNLILALLLGLLIVYLLAEIPFLGWLFTLLFVCFGTGGVITYLWSLRPSGASSISQLDT